MGAGHDPQLTEPVREATRRPVLSAAGEDADSASLMALENDRLFRAYAARATFGLSPASVGLALSDWWRHLADLVGRRSPSDRFMLRLHDFLKASQDFQRHGSRRLWYFPPGSAWLAMTDSCTYAELRGRHALEHSFFVRPEVLVRPDLAPEALLRAG